MCRFVNHSHLSKAGLESKGVSRYAGSIIHNEAGSKVRQVNEQRL